MRATREVSKTPLFKQSSILMRVLTYVFCDFIHSNYHSIEPIIGIDEVVETVDNSGQSKKMR